MDKRKQKLLNKAKQILKKLNEHCEIDPCGLSEYEVLALIFNELTKTK